MTRKELRIVRLMEPELCMDCRFAYIANVDANDTAKQKMLYCRRLDCDNWDYTTAEPATKIEWPEEIR
jgi:hypothetical protein